MSILTQLAKVFVVVAISAALCVAADRNTMKKKKTDDN